MSKIEVNTVDVASGSTLTIGSSGKTVTLATGATSSGFKEIAWQAVKTSDFTAVAGEGYFVDSSGGTKTVTLPASPSIGDTVAIHSLDGTTNAVTIARNSSNIEASTNNLTLGADYAAVTLVYSDASNGWVRHNNEAPDTFVSATGGTATTSGDYKIHTFNSSSNFVVGNISNTDTNNEVSYLVVAGGGGGGTIGNSGGGGGAGGFRENKSAVDDYTSSPLEGSTDISVTATTYPITIGAGGGINPSPSPGSSGSNSVFSTITSAGGGGGAAGPNANGLNGGSGGGGGSAGSDNGSGGSGNTPPVSPPQGKNGGNGGGEAGQNSLSGGGGGAGAVGTNADVGGNNYGGPGGNGVATSITGSAVTRAGGGGGGTQNNSSSPQPTGGSGGGGIGGRCTPATAATAGTANTGGGGGGTGGPGSSGAAAGGSGVVIIRYKYQ